MQLSKDEEKLLSQLDYGFINIYSMSPAKKQILKGLYKKGFAMKAWVITVKGKDALATRTTDLPGSST
jgi:hypothetical protein